MSVAQTSKRLQEDFASIFSVAGDYDAFNIKHFIVLQVIIMPLKPGLELNQEVGKLSPNR